MPCFHRKVDSGGAALIYVHKLLKAVKKTIDWLKGNHFKYYPRLLKYLATALHHASSQTAAGRERGDSAEPTLTQGVLICGDKSIAIYELCRYMSLCSGVPEERRPVSDGGGAHKEEAHPAVSAHPGHACAAAGDRSLHPHYWGLQVDQAQVRGGGVSLLSTCYWPDYIRCSTTFKDTALDTNKRPHQIVFKSQSPHVWQPFHASVCGIPTQRNVISGLYN